MFRSEHIDLKTSGVLNQLVYDYLNLSTSLKNFYSYFPDKSGFKKLLASAPYGESDRNKLHDTLILQSEKVRNTSEQSHGNIVKLKQKNTFTVTTGHQLCLFTGPMYFIYKIFSAINLAEELKREFPAYEFVPVYWMASEDHDFAEVNHFHLFGKKITWESKQSGAVGDFLTSELKEIYSLIREIFGNTKHAENLSKLFEESYLKHKNLSDATRYLVNELFGEYGLVIADGNDKTFKEEFRSIFKEDVFKNSSFHQVNKSSAELKQLGYEIQVNPRPINCFYLEKNQRNRIELLNGSYQLNGSNTSFTKDEMETLIEEHPDQLSPNVVLRPLYQQSILPNIAYVGGPGELAYWLEYKALFDHYQVFFPILMPRNFISIVEKSVDEKITKLKFKVEDFFKEEVDLIRAFMDQSGEVFALDKEKELFSSLFSVVLEKVQQIDKSLTGSVSAETQKTLNGLEAIVSKTNRALKQKSETEIKQIKTIKQKLFPNGLPQERYENFSYFYLRYGPGFLKEIKKQILPFSIDQKILIENTP